jgi:serine/threonine-protein kinase PknG
MTTTATTCTRPGCGGTIEGGYCDTCGLAPAAGGAGGAGAGTASGPGQPPAPSGSGARPVPSGSGSGSARSSAGSGGGRTGSRRLRAGSSRASRGHLGAGLVEIPPVPAHDPAAALLANPVVAEGKRFCGVCDHPVGRSRDGTPGLVEGYCANCGSRFSFAPKLRPGELVAGQYEVLGCLAHGGLGWIYLAMDHHLGRRWVVLKGLLNTGDASAQEAAVAERRFLAEVEHPNIVGVYNFVQHAGSGYIVMEYVGGKSLRQILLEWRQAGQSLPLPMALAYAIEVLPALGYLPSQGLVYCDFKPDNVIQTQEQLKLIDMGGVRRIDDDSSAIYGTVGYQAPEIADLGPSPSSDLYTIGRALAVLTFEFTGYQGKYAHTLPDRVTVPLLALAASEAADWRTAWYYGLRHLAAGLPGDARTAFDSVCDALPGELAAKLALGLAAEAAGDLAAAGRYFQLILTVDPAAYVSAAFGLARTRLDAGDPAGAIAALAAVPESSGYHLAAQVAAVRIRVASRPGPAQASPDDLRQAGTRLTKPKLDAIQAELLTAEILRAALDCVAAHGPQSGGQLLGYEFTDRSLRFGLERCYRAQARQAPDQHRRVTLVDLANYVRPGTWT